jgi:Flp pilus assembly pilin Flp
MSHASLSTLDSNLKILPEDETGQTMVEYVMLIVLVALAVFMLSPNVRDGILSVFQHTSSVLQ